MVHVTLFGKLFEVDLRAPEREARWWFERSWVKHALTNEQVLFNRQCKPCSQALIEAVEGFARREGPNRAWGSPGRRGPSGP